MIEEEFIDPDWKFEYAPYPQILKNSDGFKARYVTEYGKARQIAIKNGLYVNLGGAN